MTSDPRSFFVAYGDTFRATLATRGPWSPDHQHAGPPSALLAHALESALPAGSTLVRVTVEILRPLPIATFSLATHALRSGKKVQWLSADLLAADGALLARANAVAMRTTDLTLPVTGDPASEPVSPPAEARPFEFGFFTGNVGYHTAMEMRLARGIFGKGMVSMWMRMRVPLIEGLAPTPTQRVMIAADSGNGVSMSLDPKRFTFVNPDLTVYLHRPPVGEWVCLDARTIAQPRGIGLADTRLLDEQGPIGRSVQSLLVDAR
ncbi:MAG TPA: thioesterase family protein [Verrucomicrobiae bacterium]|nr:thioesterase family protein [Verrucomicrobiae bacterium]